jgi:hypothetical protein
MTTEKLQKGQSLSEQIQRTKTNLTAWGNATGFYNGCVCVRSGDYCPTLPINQDAFNAARAITVDFLKKQLDGLVKEFEEL